MVLRIPPVKWLEGETFLNCPETLALLHAYSNLKATFHGHDHALDGVRYTSNKFPHFFDWHIGGDWVQLIKAIGLWRSPIVIKSQLTR